MATETIYGSHDELHSGSGENVSERVQNLASGVYREFEVMINTYGDAVIKNLMPLVVAILESLNQAYRDKQEHEVELELLHVENDNLKIQFEREKQMRKNSEQKFLEAEDAIDEERKLNLEKVELLESNIRKLEIKVRNTQELLSRQDEREREMKDEHLKLHGKYSQLFKKHVDYVERTQQLQVTENIARSKVVSCATASQQPDGGMNRESQASMETVTQNNESNLPASLALMHNNLELPTSSLPDEDSSQRELSITEGGHSRLITYKKVDVLHGELDSKEQLDLYTDISDGDHCEITETLDRSSLLDRAYHKVMMIQCADVSQSDWPATVDDADAGPVVTEETDTREPDVRSVDASQDDALYQQCFSIPFAGNMSILHSAELDDANENLTEEESRVLSEGPALPTLNISIYDELSEHGSAVLGEVDSGADLTVASVSAAVENLIMENNELLATKNALNIVKDDLIARLDELTGEIDLLKAENEKLQRAIDDRNGRVFELEDELKKLKEANASKQENSDGRGNFTRIDLMRVLVERNQYKERLIELQDAVRRADMARVAAKEQQEYVKPQKKKSSIWGFFSELVSSDTPSEPTPQLQRLKRDSSSSHRSMVI